jgi:hypothetical protein
MAKKPEISSEEVDISPVAEEIATGVDVEEVTTEASVAHVECAADEDSTDSKPARGILATVCGGVQKGIYTSVYTVTYGVVYGALLIGGLIPVNSVVSEGMRDGLSAARKAYDGRSAQKEADVGLDEATAAA